MTTTENASRVPDLNPVTKLGLMVIYTAPLLLSLDWVSATVSLVLTLCLAAMWRVSLRAAWPLLFLAPLSGLSMLLYGAPGGKTYFEFFLITVSENSVELATAIVLRVFALALPVIGLARGIEPTELGDSLAQNLKLPARFVIGAVAGVRMLSLFDRDWELLGQARRARGLSDIARVRHLLTMSFGLLVVVLRRGGKLATAMEARGFGRRLPDGRARTWARPSPFTRRDWVALALGVFSAAVPVVVSVSVGAWRFFGL